MIFMRGNYNSTIKSIKNIFYRKLLSDVTILKVVPVLLNFDPYWR